MLQEVLTITMSPTTMSVLLTHRV